MAQDTNDEILEAQIEETPADRKKAKKNRDKAKKSKLGFMRLILFLMVMNMMTVLASMLFISSKFLTGNYTLSVLTLVFDLVGQAAVIWLIVKRKKVTRPVVIVFYIAAWVLDVTSSALLLGLDPVYDLLDAIFPAIFILYFIFSKRVKESMTEPIDFRLHDKTLAETRVMWNPKSIDFWMRMLIYFFCFSVAGHWMEMGVQVLVVNGFMPGTIAGADSLTWRDSWNPFFIYGIAVAICGIILFPLYQLFKDKCPHVWQAYVLSFIVNTVFCVLAELVLGFAFNADYSAWDYRNQPFNFMGQICLLYTICFGVMSSIITWLIFPLMERQFSYVSKEAFRIIFVVALIIFVFLFATYNVDLYRSGAINFNALDSQAVVTIDLSGSSSSASSAAS